MTVNLMTILILFFGIAILYALFHKGKDKKDDSPKNDDWFYRQWDKLKDFYYTYFILNKLYVVQVGAMKIKAGWVTVTQDDTCTFEDTLHDTSPSYMFYGKETIFVKKGIRPPISFANYIECFESVDKDKRKLLALDGRLAQVKMNNRNAEAFIRANKNADINFYLTLLAVGLLIIIVLGQFDYIHLPHTLETQKQLNEIISIINGGRP